MSAGRKVVDVVQPDISVHRQSLRTAIQLANSALFLRADLHLALDTKKFCVRGEGRQAGHARRAVLDGTATLLPRC